MINDKKDDFKNTIKYQNPDQRDVYEKFYSLLDSYQRNNSFKNREFLCYLTSAIYLTYRKIFPQLSLYIPFRTKSDMSFIKNIKKEFSNFIMNSEPNAPFDPTSIEKDISGLKIVLNDINYSLPTTDLSDEILYDPDIQKLSPFHKESPDEVSTSEFIGRVHDYLTSPIKNGREYYEFKKELLERIIKLTPEEFTEEREPNPSFTSLYNDTSFQYNFFLNKDDFPSEVSPAMVNDLKDLLDHLRSISNDKYHFAILHKTLPIVFNDPLIKNSLKTSFKFEKESKKPSGFQAIYYSLNTPFGIIEVQAQSNKAHFTATKGSAYHSGLDGKTISVKDFFELVDPNDKKDLSYYLNALDNISADKLISKYEIPQFTNEEEEKQFFSTPRGLAFIESENYREMMKHIKIKDQVELLPQYIPPELYNDNHQIDQKKLKEYVDSEKIHLVKIDTNNYLFSTALSISPYMNVCSSGHTSFTTAEIHHKKVIGEFSEVLRKKDSNTCLRDLLIRRLEDIISNPDKFLENVSEKTREDIKRSLEIANEHERTSLTLPKDVSRKNILSYAEKLDEMQNNNLR